MKFVGAEHQKQSKNKERKVLHRLLFVGVFLIGFDLKHDSQRLFWVKIDVDRLVVALKGFACHVPILRQR